MISIKPSYFKLFIITELELIDRHPLFVFIEHDFTCILLKRLLSSKL